MASTTFIDNQTTIYAAWLNDVNNAVYNGVFQSSTITATSMVCTGTASGTGFTNLINNSFGSPGAIGSGTPNTGAFTTLSATTLTATTLTVRSPLTLNGTTSGSVALAVPAVAGTNTVSLPSGSGTIAVQGLSSNIVSGTVVASTSGTAIDFTGIPSWVKRITVMFNGVSTNGTNVYIVQIGSGSFTTSGYASNVASINVSAAGTSSYSAGFGFVIPSAASNINSGAIRITNLTGNVWVEEGSVASTETTRSNLSAGSITLGGVLDRLRITTLNNTDTFDAGSINILYE
jgi:hypothetical protein